MLIVLVLAGVKLLWGGGEAPLTASDGADSIIKACFLGNENPPTGKYFRNGIRIPIDIYYPTQVLDEYKKFEIVKKNIDKLAWWIPIRKWRDNFRNKILNADQT